MTAGELEVWKNRGRGLFVMNKLSIDGSKRAEPIPGGREFQVTAEERRTHQASCASDKLDPFRNGVLVPVNELAVAALGEIAVTRVQNPWSTTAAPSEPEGSPMGVIPQGPETPAQRIERLRRELAEAEAGAQDPSYQVVDEERERPLPPVDPAPATEGRPPNVLTDEEVNDILTGHGNRAKALLARVDAPAILELLFGQSLEVSSPPRIELIERRWLELDPDAKPVRPGGGSVSVGDDPAGPQVPDPERSGPQRYDLDGVDQDDDGPLVPAPGSESRSGSGPKSLVGRPDFVAPD